jgi:hypothetical protein
MFIEEWDCPFGFDCVFCMASVEDLAYQEGLGEHAIFTTSKVLHPRLEQLLFTHIAWHLEDIALKGLMGGQSWGTEPLSPSTTTPNTMSVEAHSGGNLPAVSSRRRPLRAKSRSPAKAALMAKSWLERYAIEKPQFVMVYPNTRTCIVM